MNLPALPVGQTWPEHMLADTPTHKRLRASYARISRQVEANEAPARDRIEALHMLQHAWCRVPTGEVEIRS